MRGIAFFASMLALACGAAAAPPKKKAMPVGEPAMQVYLVRSNHPGCEPQCPQWIAAQGRIMPGTANKFRKVLREVGDRKLPIFIDSIGRLDQRCARHRTPHPLQGPACSSQRHHVLALPTRGSRLPQGQDRRRAARDGAARIFQVRLGVRFHPGGGTRRLVGQGAAVGVHQGIKIQRMYWVRTRRAYDGSIKTKKTLAWEGKGPVDRKTNADTRKYLAEMGISDVLISLIESTPHESIRRLAPWELQATRLATEYLNGEQLITNTPAPPWPSPRTVTPLLVQPSAPIPSPGGSGVNCTSLAGAIRTGRKMDVPSSNVMRNPLLPPGAGREQERKRQVSRLLRHVQGLPGRPV